MLREMSHFHSICLPCHTKQRVEMIKFSFTETRSQTNLKIITQLALSCLKSVVQKSPVLYLLSAY